MIDYQNSKSLVVTDGINRRTCDCGFFLITGVQKTGDEFWARRDFICGNCGFDNVRIGGGVHIYHRDIFDRHKNVFHVLSLVYPPSICQSCGHLMLAIELPCVGMKAPSALFGN